MADQLEPLPPYSGDTPACTKCGFKGASTLYMGTGQCLHNGFPNRTIGFSPNERLHRECARCSHQWDEALAAPAHAVGDDAGACTDRCQGTQGLRGLMEHAGIDTTGRNITVDGKVVDAAPAGETGR